MILPDMLKKMFILYYGTRMSRIHKKILHNIAKEKGLEEYDMQINNTSIEYKMGYVKYK